ncbi:MAG: DUF1778 domain-containing protein [Hyphomicrobium sp.]|jgi:uncharacterized protein (DUF1778 family)
MALGRKTGPASSLINLRADIATRDLIDRAAAATGQNRTEFMLGSARAHAEHVLLNQVYFQLDDADWTALNTALESPPAANDALKKALRTVPAWKRR